METSAQPLSITCAGDAMISENISNYQHPKFKELLEIIGRSDIGLINLEVVLRDNAGYPASNGPGTYMGVPSSMADELALLGFNLYSAATNHTMDYSHGGLKATINALKERNLSFAGIGYNLAEARSPTYVETGKGRIALISACSTITTGSIAGKQRPDMKGRPGLSPLRYNTIYKVPKNEYESLEAISDELQLEEYKEQLRVLGFPLNNSRDELFTFVNLDGDTHIKIEESTDFSICRELNPKDVEEIKNQIRRAERQADKVIVSLHSHEGEGPRTTDSTVAAFIERFARECIENGADIFVGHGSHTLRGIEIYEGSPIFYSLGNFIAQNKLINRQPSELYERYGLADDAHPADIYDLRSPAEQGEYPGFLSNREYFESVIPVVKFSDGLEMITLHPLDLMMEKPRSQRGRPILATEEIGESIIQRIQELSDPYGTEIVNDSSKGKIIL